MDDPIEVALRDGNPVSFVWNDRMYWIADILHVWESEEATWWRWASRERRRHYRIQAGWNRHRITAEIYHSTSGSKERWVLSRIYD